MIKSLTRPDFGIPPDSGLLILFLFVWFYNTQCVNQYIAKIITELSVSHIALSAEIISLLDKVILQMKSDLLILFVSKKVIVNHFE